MTIFFLNSSLSDLNYTGFACILSYINFQKKQFQNLSPPFKPCFTHVFIRFIFINIKLLNSSLYFNFILFRNETTPL